MKHILRCHVCNSYTMLEKHCEEKTLSSKPGKYSPEDKFGKYRRVAKKEILKERGLY